LVGKAGFFHEELSNTTTGVSSRNAQPSDVVDDLLDSAIVLKNARHRYSDGPTVGDRVAELNYAIHGVSIFIDEIALQVRSPPCIEASEQLDKPLRVCRREPAQVLLYVLQDRTVGMSSHMLENQLDDCLF